MEIPELLEVLYRRKRIYHPSIVGPLYRARLDKMMPRCDIQLGMRVSDIGFEDGILLAKMALRFPQERLCSLKTVISRRRQLLRRIT